MWKYPTLPPGWVDEGATDRTRAGGSMAGGLIEARVMVNFLAPGDESRRWSPRLRGWA